MRSLTEYRAMLEQLKGGTIPADLALEIVHAAEEAIEAARGELTLAQAMERSGKSRSYFERRVEDWSKQGMARKLGRTWLVRMAVVSSREQLQGGFDPATPDDEILAALERMDRLAS